MSQQVPQEADDSFFPSAEPISTKRLITVINAQGFCERASISWERYTGQSSAQMLGWGWIKAVEPTDRVRMIARWSEMARSGMTSEFEAECRIRRTDGTYHTFLIWGMPYFMIGTSVETWSLFCVDIEKYLKQDHDHERLAVLDVVAHELRTPLTSMKLIVQFMAKHLRDGIQPELAQIERLDLSMNRLSSLVNDLLDTTSIEKGKFSLEKEPCDMNRLCIQAIDEQNLTSQREVYLDMPDAPVMVDADPKRVIQVLCNLLSNALKYTPDDTPVTISLHRHDKSARVEVIDHGPGIPPEQKNRIFDRFYRIEGHTERKSGLGLGLYLCKMLIEAHKGHIGVRGKMGRGAIFWFTLRLAQA